MGAYAKTIGLRAGSILVFVLIWWVASRLMDDAEVLPSPLTVGAAIMADLSSTGPQGLTAYHHIGLTLARIFIAFAASMLAGIGIGLAMGLSRTLELALLAVIPLMLTMPTAAGSTS